MQIKYRGRYYICHASRYSDSREAAELAVDDEAWCKCALTREERAPLVEWD
jgi:hypothetical protein